MSLPTFVALSFNRSPQGTRAGYDIFVYIYVTTLLYALMNMNMRVLVKLAIMHYCIWNNDSHRHTLQQQTQIATCVIM